jgi:predicted Zn-dependent peptidase
MEKNMELRKLLNFFDFDYDSTDVDLLKITNENKKELEIRQNCFKNEKDLSGPMIYLIDNQGGQELSLIRFFITEDTVKNIVDKMDVTQGKLVMGYRANIDFADAKKYYALVLGCNILGGGPHSKMFINIREKESLCYYIYSSIEKYKSILFVSSGIEVQNYDKTVELVRKQIEAITNGDITNEEIENSKTAMISSMKSLTDSIGGLSDFQFAQDISKTNLEIEEIIQYIDNATKDEIVSAIKEIKLDTIYFLRN